MKKKDRELLDDIRTSLETVSDSEKLPEILSAQSIASVVENTEQSKNTKMSGKQKRTTAFATIAAVFVLCVCVFFAHRASKNPSAVVPTPKTTQAQDSVFKDAPMYTAGNYEAIEQRFMKVAKEYALESKLTYEINGIAGDMEKSSAAEDGAQTTGETAESNATPTEVGSGGGDDYARTNVQVNGVDEADIVKTDGKYLYIVTNDFEYIKNSNGEKTHSDNFGTVKVVDIRNSGEMQVVSTVLPTAKKKQTRVRDLYVSGNNLIVICSEWDYDETRDYYQYYYPAFKENTLVVVYDMTDRAEIKEKGRYAQDGYYLSSRLIGNRVYVFSNYSVDVYNGEEKAKETCIPQCGTNGTMGKISAGDICVMRSTDRNGYIVIGSVNFYGEDLSPTAKAVLGGGEECYCTADTLYISNSVYDYELYTQQQLTDEEINVDMGRTEIFAFLLNEGRIEYKNYGTVSGVVDDQFSMDEYNGYFRIATTVGWNGYSIVTVLDKNLKRVGELTKIAEGEEIKSVRFIGDTAYVVTYENHDPLHVIDLSDPKKPKILGQLEVPGFSSYLHPVGDKYLLGIGQDTDEEGQLTTEYENTKLSVFDISDPMNPTEVSKVVLDGYSTAQDNHKVFTVLPDGSFMIPVNLYYYSDGDGDGYYGFKEENRSVRFTVDEDGRIIIDRSFYCEHVVDTYTFNEQPETEETNPDTEEAAEPDETTEYYYEPDVRTYYNTLMRIAYSNSVVYNIGELYVEAFNIETGEKIGEVQILDSQKLFERDREYYFGPVYNGAEVPTEKADDAEVDTSLAETTTVAVTN